MTRDDEFADDRQARAAALDTSRSFIVQAPAGSGKTELLIQRYLRLLATVDEPEQVLAITFTRKAAAEMQVRVLDSLMRARRGETPDAAHQRTTIDAAREVLDRSAGRDWDLEANPRRLRIQTLDSLNAAIARMQPLTASASTYGNAVPDDAALKALYARAAAATLDWLAEEGPLRDATREVLLHLDTNTSIYIAYLARMLQTRDQWLPFIGEGRLGAGEAGTLRAELESSLRQIVTRHLGTLCETARRLPVTQLLPLLDHAGRHGGDLASLAGLEALPGSAAEDLDTWLAMADVLLTKDGRWRKTVDRRQGFPPGEKVAKPAMRELLEALSGESVLAARLHGVRSLPPCRYRDEQWSVLEALFRLLPLAVAELERLFAIRGSTDYIDIALIAADALGSAGSPGDIALLLDYQLSHILVDEMQDTSRAQYRMLEALMGGWEPGDGRTLFCVGDPMQSIYRFRNAEVAQFLLAKHEGIGHLELEPLVLRQNFRSGERLVDWFNATFPAVLAAEDDATTGAVSYAPAVAVDAHRGAGAVEVHPLFGASVAAEAEVGIGVVRETLARNPDDDVAILVRSRTQLSALLDRLRDARIEYQAIDIDRLTDLPEIIDALAITRAIVHPGDRLAWLGMLRSPAIGLDWNDLKKLVGDDVSSTVPELLGRPDVVERLSPRGRSAIRRASAVLSGLLEVQRSGSLRDRVEQAWLSLGGAALQRSRHAIDNVYRYLEVLARLEVAGTLEDVAELEAQLDLERVSSNADARLRIMTMHRAKGLQFDHVILYGLGRVSRQSDRSVLGWYDLPDEHGVEHKVLSPVGPRAEIESDPIHRYIELAEAERDRHEYGRLLYVACTRARRSLHLVGHTRVDGGGAEHRSPDGRSLLGLLWPVVEPEFDAAFGHVDIAAADEAVDWLTPRLRRLPVDWRLPEPSRLPVPGQRAARSHEIEVEVDYDWVGSGARSAGTIVHRWLARIADGRTPLDPGREEVRRVSSRWLREAGVAEAQHATILARVEQALAGVARHDRGRWLLESPGHAELALSAAVDGEIASVRIDRVRIDAGEHWVVDYKTSTHEGGNLDGFLAAEVDRYRGQLDRYARIYATWSGVAPRCALYFPMLERFVEVEVRG